MDFSSVRTSPAILKLLWLAGKGVEAVDADAIDFEQPELDASLQLCVQRELLPDFTDGDDGVEEGTFGPSLSLSAAFGIAKS